VLVAVASAGAKAGLVLFELRRTAAQLGTELSESGERFVRTHALSPVPDLSPVSTEHIDALADLAGIVPAQATAPAEVPEPVHAVPTSYPAPQQPYFPSYEPSLPGVGTALAGLEPPFPVLSQHVPTPPSAQASVDATPAQPATTWPSWS
jgi:hypothetical protein